MPSRERTVSDAIRVLRGARYPAGLELETAWLGIYQTLLWYEPVNWVGFTELPHIIDTDKLRPSSPSKRRSWVQPSIWQRRAQSLSTHLAERLDCAPEDAGRHTDLLMRLPDYEGMQRQNTLGIAFVGLVSHLLESFGSAAIEYDQEVDAGTVFPGVAVPGRSRTPRIDILCRNRDGPVAVVSAKWSVRHDRVNDITNECPVYKAAYQRIYRQSGAQMRYYVLTNEYDPARLNKMLDDSCVDAVAHVHKDAVVEICGLNGRLERLMDLADFVRQTEAW